MVRRLAVLLVVVVLTLRLLPLVLLWRRFAARCQHPRRTMSHRLLRTLLPPSVRCTRIVLRSRRVLSTRSGRSTLPHELADGVDLAGQIDDIALCREA